jgi:hypothetical protein
MQQLLRSKPAVIMIASLRRLPVPTIAERDKLASGPEEEKDH